MIRVAVVDDDEVFANELSRSVYEEMCRRSVQCEICDFRDGKSVLDSHSKKEFQLIMLDIGLPDDDGFDVAGKINLTGTNTQIIFITSKVHLVFDSFEYMPVAFIPKDNYKKDLSKYIGIFLRKHETNGYRFEYSSENGDKSIDLKSIIYFSANNHDIFFVKNNRDIVNISSRRENLTSLRDKLADKGFISVSRTYLVNYRYILSLSRDYIQLSNNQKIKINRNKYSLIVEEYKKFKRGDDL